MGPYKFAKKERLRKRWEFIALSQDGKKVQNQYFLALYRQNDLKRSRLGITVTKKVGNAAVRNQIKRYCREFFRLNKNRLSDYLDINFIAKKKAADLDGRETFRILEDLFRKF